MKVISKVLIMVLLIITFFSICTFADDTQSYRSRILYINSYSADFFLNRERIDAFSDILPDASIDQEYMDSKRFSEAKNIELFYNHIKYKISKLDKYDIIVAVDDNAYEFTRKYQDELFKNIPIVFYGVNNKMRALDANGIPNMTGVVEATSMEETIQTAMKMIPEAKKVVALTDGTTTCAPYRKHFLELADSYPDYVFEELSLVNYTFEDYYKEVNKLQDGTIVILTTTYRDMNGNSMDFDTQLNNLMEYSNVPIFHLWKHGIDAGLVGGKVVSHSHHGKFAAEIVRDILSGQSIEDIDVVTESPNAYIFNKNILNKYDIKKSILPQQSILIHNEDSKLIMYKRFLTALSFLLIMSIVIVFIQQYISRKRRKVQRVLQEKNDELTSLYEELYASEGELTLQFQRLNDSYRKYQLILDSSHNALFDYDYSTRKLTTSPNFNIVVGNDKFLSNNTLISFKSFVNYVHQEDKDTIIKFIDLVDENEVDEFNVDFRLLQNDDTFKWFNLFGKVLHTETKIPALIAGSISDIHDSKLVADKNKKLAYYDNLTGLANRSLLYKSVQESFTKNEIENAVTLFIDIDNFKYINDTYGHEFGDMVLNRVGDKFSKYNGDNCLVSRIGGDEFILFINDTKENSNRIIKHIYKTFTAPIIVNNKELYINISIGASIYPDNGSDLDELIINADLAMYKAKSLGKDTYKFFEQSMRDEMKSRSEMHNELRNAISNNELSLHYQPKYDLKTSKITSYEALLRWNNHKYGFISPAKFIPLAEETGLILEISKWVLNNACQFIKRTGSKVSINVSPVELTSMSYLSNIKNTIDNVGINPSLLGLEVTENALVQNFNLVVDILDGLMDYGVKVYLDDFGKGYSSLNYLRRLPINYLKIDKSFVDDIVDDSQAKFIIDTIISIAHNLNLKVIAEGVETQDQMDTLQSLNCDQIQGFLLAKPMSEQVLIEENFIKNIG